MFQCQDCFNKACGSRSAFGVADIWFHLLRFSLIEENALYV